MWTSHCEGEPYSWLTWWMQTLHYKGPLVNPLTQMSEWNQFAFFHPNFGADLMFFLCTNPEHVCQACSDFTPSPQICLFWSEKIEVVEQGFCSCPKVCMSCLVDEFHPRICLFWREKILKSKYSSADDRVPKPVYYHQLPGLLADKHWILISEAGRANWNIEIVSLNAILHWLCEFSCLSGTFCSWAWGGWKVIEPKAQQMAGSVFDSLCTYGCVHTWMCM